MKPLTLFVQPAVLEQIGFARIAKFLDSFADDLKAANLTIPPLKHMNRFYFAEVAHFLAATNDLPDSLRQTMAALESAAARQNEHQLDTLIKRHIPNVSLNRSCPLDCALELWFTSPKLLSEGGFTAPAEPASFKVQSSTVPGSAVQSPTVQGSTVPGSTVQSSEPSTFNLQPSTAPQTTDAETFRKLAQLSPADYDRARKEAARSLRVRVETLDAEVTRVRNQLVEDAMLQSALATLRSPEPWPEPVNGAEVLTQIVERFLYYVILPPGAPEALTLWSAQAHCFFAFIQSPRLNICSPEGGCGKTTALDVIATLTPRALRTENLTAPVLFRLVHQYQPTLLLDEVDSWLPQAEELRGLLNAGHKRGACAYRCEGEGNAVRPFRAFGPAVLSGIGQLTGTLHDRSIVVPLMKAEAGQILHRFDNYRVEIETELCRKLARWTADNFAALKACEPPLPPTAFNRLADNWRPLFAIAHIAGGPWPELALNSFNHLSNPPLPPRLPPPLPQRTPPPVGTLSTASPINDSSPFTPDQANGSAAKPHSQLLLAIRQIFAETGATRLSAKQLAEALSALPNRSIQQSGAKVQLTPARLSRQLARLGIPPRNVRIAGRVVRGFESTDFIPRDDLRDP